MSANVKKGEKAKGNEKDEKVGASAANNGKLFSFFMFSVHITFDWSFRLIRPVIQGSRVDRYVLVRK